MIYNKNTPEGFLEEMIFNARIYHGGADYETMMYLLNDYSSRSTQYNVDNSEFIESVRLLIVMQFPQGVIS